MKKHKQLLKARYGEGGRAVELGRIVRCGGGC